MFGFRQNGGLPVTATFLQTWAWGDFQQSLGWKIWRYIGEEGGVIKEVALVIKHELPHGLCWLYVPMPFSLSQEMEHQLMELAHKESAILVRADFQNIAQVLSGWKKALREVQPKDTLLLDVTRSEDELLTGMHHKTRYNIRLAQKKGVTVRFSTDVKDVDIFLNLATHVSGRSTFSYHPDEYYRKFVEVLGREGMAEVAIAEHEGEPLAAHIIVYANLVATYVHGASSQEKRELMAPQLLYWETIRRAKERGCLTFDFYGVAPENADNNHPWVGITRVKMGFGGKRVGYAGAYDLILKPIWYWGINMARSLRR
ncbi:MAG: peptidoglycan bridge formation glycyltransferase FemA/FemB family protein [Candidatus Andersenbacteria bacterium]|nr:peptidoglycan bridge formation glycyltransferase FemA/FemB family protein [Candidatus Andersenbacteria bacterium]